MITRHVFKISHSTCVIRVMSYANQFLPSLLNFVRLLSNMVIPIFLRGMFDSIVNVLS